jgi:HK97 gp10 family phage protein
MSTLKRLLGGVDAKHVRPLHRAALLGVAASIRDKARQLVPVRSDKRLIKRSNGKFRKAGNLKKSISAKPLKPKSGRADTAIVYAKSGSKYANDGYYWRMVEKGSKTRGGKSRQPARPFLSPAVKQVQGRLDLILEQKFTAAFERRIKNELKRQASMNK